VLEFDASVRRCEVPVRRGVIGIAVVFPGGDFVDERVFIRNAPVETLDDRTPSSDSARSSQLPCFGVKCHSKRSTSLLAFGGRKSLIERCPAVDVEIVLDQYDCSGVCEVDIGQSRRT